MLGKLDWEPPGVYRSGHKTKKQRTGSQNHKWVWFIKSLVVFRVTSRPIMALGALSVFYQLPVEVVWIFCHEFSENAFLNLKSIKSEIASPKFFNLIVDYQTFRCCTLPLKKGFRWKNCRRYLLIWCKQFSLANWNELRVCRFLDWIVTG